MRRILRTLLALVPCAVLGGALSAPIQAYADGVTSDSVKLTYSDRTELGDGLAHYRYDLTVGPGQYDKVRIHRIVRESRPDKPVRTRDGVMLLHGSPGNFEGFLASMVSGVSDPDHSIAVFLAKNDIDVWGIDLGWALVPVEETDFGFMAEWGVAKDVAHTEAALSFVRSIRVRTGQGNGKLHVLGFSYGGQLAYMLAGEEATRPPGLRNVKGIVPIDVAVKFEDAADREAYCAAAIADAATLASGEYANRSGWLFQVAAYLASVDPEGESPITPQWGMTMSNWQAVLFAGTSTNLLTGLPWHMVGGYFDESGLPTGLRFTDEQLFIAAVGMMPAYYPVKTDVDLDEVMCGTVETPLDDHLAQIAIPIFQIAAKGGFGPSAFASTTATASRDITTMTIQFMPDADRALDFGHFDTMSARNAEALVWQPILDWIIAHRENRP